jgi:hypothetical protein
MNRRSGEVAMNKRIRTLQVLLISAVVAAAGSAPAGQARTAETVVCNSTVTPRVDLTGTWRGNDGATYRIRQVGTCVWWAATTTAFFGSVSSTGSTVFGLWASVTGGENGSVLLTVRSSRSLTRRGSTGGFPASILRQTRTS